MRGHLNALDDGRPLLVQLRCVSLVAFLLTLISSCQPRVHDSSQSATTVATYPHAHFQTQGKESLRLLNLYTCDPLEVCVSHRNCRCRSRSHR